MRRIIIGLFALVFAAAACRSRVTVGTTKDSAMLARQEDSNRKYFLDSFANVYWGAFDKDSLHSFRHFFKTRYPEIHTAYPFDPLPYAFEEEYVDTTRIDPGRLWFRVMVSPCFAVPYCLTLDQKAGRTWLTLKLTSSIGRNTIGQLYITKRFVVSDSILPKLFLKLDSLGFWKMGLPPDCSGFDGDTWQFEAIDNGRYKYLERWSPEGCGEPAAIALSAIGEDLAKIANLEDYRDLVLKEVHQIYRNKRGGH